MARQSDDRSRIKDEEHYDALRKKGMSEKNAARIANTSRQEAGGKGGTHSRYADWTVDQLYSQAQKVGIRHRSSMSRDELIEALSKH